MPTPKEFASKAADGRRDLLHLQMRQRFIGREERFARCESAAKSMGYKNIFSLGRDHGVTHQSMKSSMNSNKLSVVRLEELCVMLKCSVSYLTERDIKGLK